MKWLVGISALQLLLVGLLIFRLDAIESRLESLAATGQPTAEVGERLADSVRATPSRSGYEADEAVLHRIIRQELSAILAAAGPEHDSEHAVAPSDTTEAAVNPDTSDHYESGLVRGELDYYTSRGAITAAEMAGLQTRIAALPAKERTRMLQELATALNSGDLQGRL
jgi:hypothetical protein